MEVGMKKALSLLLPLCILLAAAAPPLPADEAASQATPMFLVGLWPTLGIPSPADENAELFGLGGSGRLEVDGLMPFLPFLYALGALEYGYSSLVVEDSLSLLSGSAGLGARIPLTDVLTLRAHAAGGYYYMLVNSGSADGAGNFFVDVGIGGALALGPSFSVGVDASYRWAFSLSQSIAIGIGASYGFGPAVAAPAEPAPQKKPAEKPKPQPLEQEAQQKPAEAGSAKSLAISGMKLESIFPIFHTYYDTHPVGTVTLTNKGDSAATDVTVSFVIKQYMDAPKKSQPIASLAPGESKTVELYALFKSDILGITEATKLTAQVAVSYTFAGAAATVEDADSIRVYDRNAMMWDDNRKAAAFVTAKEPAVLLFSNNVNAAVKDRLNRAVDHNLQVAMALHDALRLYGMSYVSNPLTPYSEVSKNKLAVDTLKFPRQTFEYHSGDCSDLTLLYCALMESMQMETAFITIPGHIFMAFALKASPEEARAGFSHPDELIFRGEKAWVPVEVTEREGGFLAAWTAGAKEWRENLARNQADFYPVHDAWKLYEPVGLPGSAASPQVPAASKVLAEFQAEITKYVEQEIMTRVAALQAAITKSKESPKSLNALGVLYARYDLTDKAETQFKKAIVREEYVASLINLGNLSCLKDDYEGALAFYQRGYTKAPKNPAVLLGLARASQELEDYRTTKKTYDELKAVSPELARQFAYLELRGQESTRAAEAGGAKETMVWDE
jgi:tetratricopeptide (TPR) repeat protein